MNSTLVGLAVVAVVGCGGASAEKKPITNTAADSGSAASSTEQPPEPRASYEVAYFAMRRYTDEMCACSDAAQRAMQAGTPAPSGANPCGGGP